MQNRSESDSTAPKAQQEPQCPWRLDIVLLLLHKTCFFLEFDRFWIELGVEFLIQNLL